MNKETFDAIFNLLATFGDTRLSKSNKSINCFTFIDDTSQIDKLLPVSWSCKTQRAQYNNNGAQISSDMTTVFCAKTQTADEAFASFEFAQ